MATDHETWKRIGGGGNHIKDEWAPLFKKGGQYYHFPDSADWSQRANLYLKSNAGYR